MKFVILLNFLFIIIFIQGENYYRDKLKYLLSAKLDDKYWIYPDFINLEEDINILENKKRLFRNSINNYCLNNDYNLCFIHTKDEKKIH